MDNYPSAQRKTLNFNFIIHKKAVWRNWIYAITDSPNGREENVIVIIVPSNGSYLIERSTKLRTTILLPLDVVWYGSCFDNAITDDSEWYTPTTEGLRIERGWGDSSSTAWGARVERTLRATPVEWLHRPPVPLPASHYCTSRDWSDDSGAACRSSCRRGDTGRDDDDDGSAPPRRSCWPNASTGWRCC